MITDLIPKSGLLFLGPAKGTRGPMASCIGCLPIFVMPERTGLKNKSVVFASRFCVSSLLPAMLAPVGKLCEKKGCSNNG